MGKTIETFSTTKGHSKVWKSERQCLEERIQQEEKISRIREILKYQDKFLAYQELPPFLHSLYEKSDINYSSHQLAWDGPRLDWMFKSLPTTIKTAVEIGSSLGYFSLMLSHARGINVTAFEPVTEYAELSNILASLGNLEEKAYFHGTGVTLRDISQLPVYDPNDVTRTTIKETNIENTYSSIQE